MNVVKLKMTDGNGRCIETMSFNLDCEDPGA